MAKSPHVCVCGKTFTGQRFLSRHYNQCPVYNTGDAQRTHRRGPSTSALASKRIGRGLFSLGSAFAPRHNHEGTGRSPVPNTDLEPMEVDDVGDDAAYEMDRSPSPGPAPTPVTCTPPADPVLDPRERINRGRLPQRYRDMQPEGPEDLVDDPADNSPPPSPRRFVQLAQGLRLRLRATFRTAKNSFGLSRLYVSRPDAIPDKFAPLVDCDTPDVPQPGDDALPPLEDVIAPYPNFSSWLFNRWYWGRHKKSRDDRRTLIKDVLSHEDFSVDDITHVDFDRMDQLVADADSDSAAGDTLGNGWRRGTVPIRVPHYQKGARLDEQSYTFNVDNVLHRSILRVIEDVYSKPSACHFHYTPFKLSWDRPAADDGPHTSQRSENVYSELYCSQSFDLAHEEVQKLPPEPGCDLPRAVAAVMLASDAAHLTDTGSAKIHPLHFMAGNQPMYERAKPSNRAVYPIAFFVELPFQQLRDFIQRLPGNKARKRNHPIFTHCRRELFQGTLKLVFDDEFWHAYEHGIVVDCADGVRRRLYPRIFTYIADYPEKVMVATIRDQGRFPCPRCLVPQDQLDQMGTAEDMDLRQQRLRHDSVPRQKAVEKARRSIYKKGYAVDSKKVEDLLKDESYVPTTNAFSDTRNKDNYFQSLACDHMHECVLGELLKVLKHLVRILYTFGEGRVIELNRRYRSMAPFGRDSVRRFTDEIATFSRKRAHEYANLLECSPPAFEGLFPEPFDSLVQDLLFTFARFHVLSKLRMHTDSTVSQLDGVTRDLGNLMRQFQYESAQQYQTVETPAEAEQRARKASASGGGGSTTPLPKGLNLSTYKFHSLGDYATTIKQFGSMYGYTTERNELSLRDPIDSYARSSKNNYEAQVARNHTRKQFHSDVHDKLVQLGTISDSNSKAKKRGEQVFEGAPEARYHIAKEDANRVSIDAFLSTHAGDPAFKHFRRDLQSHCYARILDDASLPSTAAHVSRQQRSLVEFHNDSLYMHQKVAFNYTTYDVRRAQDSISTNRKFQRQDIMLLADEDDDDPHPFWYARVLNIFHVKVRHPSRLPVAQRMDVLHVRWFGRDPTFAAGWASRRLDRIGYVPATDRDAFGFLDPSQVLRACHLIQGFHHGMTDELVGPSCARDSPAGDWNYYYVGRFSEPDLMMRFTGLGVGHVATLPKHIDMREPEPIAEFTQTAAVPVIDSDSEEDAGDDLATIDEATERGVEEGASGAQE